MRMTNIGVIALLGIGFMAGCLIALTSIKVESSAEAAGGKVESPVKALDERDVYYPRQTWLSFSL